MEESRKVAIGAVIAVLLQLVIAPYVVIAGANANFILTYVVMVCIIKPHEQHYVLAYVLGLCSDLMGSGLVGGMSFVLLIGSFLVSRMAEVVGGDNAGSACALSALSTFVLILVYALLISFFGLLEMPAGIVYFVIPVGLFSAVISCLWYLAGSRFLSASRMSTTSAMTPNIRFH